MAFKPATLSDVKQVEPNIDELGIIDIQTEINNAATDVLRDLQTRWWPTYCVANSCRQSCPQDPDHQRSRDSHLQIYDRLAKIWER